MQVLDSWRQKSSQVSEPITLLKNTSLVDNKDVNNSPVTRIFISYSHKDESFKDEFVTMFAGLQRQGRIETWNDQRIIPGEEWLSAIQSAMENCTLVILLISPDFIASTFNQTKELVYLLKRRIEEGLYIVPIIIRPCLWQNEPVLRDLQGLPKDGMPVVSFSKDNGARDQVWADICKSIEIFAVSL